METQTRCQHVWVHTDHPREAGLQEKLGKRAMRREKEISRLYRKYDSGLKCLCAILHVHDI